MGFNQPLAGLTSMEFARYFRTFANATFIRPLGPEQADLRNFSPKNINWGFMFNRRPISFVGKWYLIGKRRLTPTAAGVFGAPGWNYYNEKLRSSFARLPAHEALLALCFRPKHFQPRPRDASAPPRCGHPRRGSTSSARTNVRVMGTV